MKAPKFYAVRSGHKPGVYRTWDECKAQVNGYSNAEYKSFGDLKSAQDFVSGIQARQASPPRAPEHHASIPDHNSGQVLIYADGACTGNPGPGGYGVLLIHQNERRELSAGFRLTTNNRMEILGCIAGLQELPHTCDVTIYSDSRYVVNAMTQSWAVRWRKLGWKRRDENGDLKDALNADLWAQMLELCDRHRVTFEWVRGHA